MKKIYKKNWLFNRKAIATACALLFTGGAAMAQLSGTYTLDSSSASNMTAGNFQSFSDLADSLNTFGVSGAVTINVTAGQGNFVESPTFNAIFGASSTNTITINGNGNTLENASNLNVNVNGADYLTFDNMTFRNTSTLSNTRGFWVHNNSDYLTVSNCTFTITAVQRNGSHSAFIYFTASSTGASYGDHGTNYTIKDNVFGDGGVGSYYVTYGIRDYRGSSYNNSTINAVITGNKLERWADNGIDLFYANDAIVSENEVANNFPDNSYKYPIRIYRNDGNYIQIDSNYIHDIEGSGFYLYNIDAYYCDNSSSTRGSISGNRIDESLSTYYYNYGIRAYYCDNIDINDNEVGNLESTYQYGRAYGIYGYRCDNSTANRNHVHDVSSGYGYPMYFYYFENSEINDNLVEDIVAKYFTNYGVYLYRSTGEFSRNTIRSLSQTYQWGYCYGLYGFYNSDLKITNNKIYDLSGQYYVYGMYFYWYGTGYSGVEVANNTIITEDFTASNQIGNCAGIYYYHYNSPETPAAALKNNLIAITDNNSNYETVGIWAYNGEPEINNNNIYVPTGNAGYLGAMGTTAQTTLAGWQTASGGDLEMSYDPEFVDMSGGDFTPQSVDMANRGEGGIVSDDFGMNSRPSCGVDPGAIEYYTDFSASNFTLSSADRCGNTTDEITFDVTNGNADPRTSLDVYYTLNGSQVDEATDTVHDNTTLTYTFMDMPVYHEPGVNTVTVGITCDDNDANNELTQTFTVVASPSGGDMVQATTFDGYFNAGDMINPDVAVPNVTNVYDIVEPSKYATLGTYGVDWDITNVSMTSGGMAVDASHGVDVDETNGLTVTVSPDSSLTDSMVYVAFSINDLVTGCDSVVGRWMYVPFTPDVQFEIADVCLGTTAQFKNRTNMGGTDFMLYKWRYNDPNSDEDTSEIKDGFWLYEDYGTYDVTLEVVNQMYPKFVYSLTQSITVTPTPLTDFSVKNECEGVALTFTNQTTSPVSGTITYKWNFGDGNTSTSDLPTVNHTYAGPDAEGYPVTLTATQNGCDASVSKTAYQFARPVADFASNGACNLEEVEFTNNTTIAVGKSGYTWDFGDNGISTLENPTHVYSTHGTHSVTLTAYSEFGCEDDVTIDITLLESPEADFTYDATCNLTPVNFTFSGTAPAGVPTSYDWDFNGEASGAGQNVSYQFPEVGTKVISLAVTSANGCSSEISEEIDVVLQAIADFDVADVCEGDEAVFINKSRVAAGDLSYTWLFGESDVNGNNTSDHVSPTHAYTVQNATRIVNVTLVAEVDGGCNAEITKALTVNAAPVADFTADADGRNLVISGVTTGYQLYNWRFGDGASSTDEVPTYVYDNVDNGEFEVCVSIKNENCWSDHCEMVYVDLLSVEDLSEDNSMIEVYPNPNNGTFNLEIENAGDNVTIKVADILGNEIEISVVDNLDGSYVVDLSTVADGVYFVQVSNGDYFATQRITVSK